MSRAPATGRTPATELRVRLRADGRVLLELFDAPGRLLCSAEGIAAEVEKIAEILTFWAWDPGRSDGAWSPELQQADGVEFRRPYGEGLLIAHRHRAWRNGADLLESKADVLQFREIFGAVGPADTEACRIFCARLANEISRRCRSAQIMAVQRLAGSKYLKVLDAYVEQLRALASDQRGYRRVPESLKQIIENEEYLLISTEARARELMEEFYEVLHVLYGQCQDLERGGVVGLRDLPKRRRPGCCTPPC